ncbi:hypothetical protein [Flavobacterium ustbae]|uniref:hypothetical protein n=1 Tax=Flavobacterium ustbae TaxID=2488790 RepID=UPI000F76F594|nr:hypothetical protein [Flavobacterium ustbae]
MSKGNVIHDTIILVKRDTIIKMVEIIKDQNKSVSPHVDFFNTYSNVFTGYGTIATFLAVVVAIIAIYRSTKDSRNQILANKVEEIYELVETLSSVYGHLFAVYIILENSSKKEIELKGRLFMEKEFREKLATLKETYDIEDFIKKSIRLNILANSYLKANVKYDVIGFSQLFIAILYILNYEDVKLRQPEFKDPLPKPANVFELTTSIVDQLRKIIGFSNKTKGYIHYRNNTFKSKIYPK